MSVGKVCVRTVVTTRPEESVAAAAKRMRQYNVGALVVVDGQHPVGIVTDRDLVLRVLAVERRSGFERLAQGPMGKVLVRIAG